MKVQQSKVRRRHAGIRHRRTYNYSASDVALRLRSVARGITWSHMLALLILLAMSSLLVWFFVDARFFIYEVEVQGNTLVSAEEVYEASGLHTMSIFFVDPARVAKSISNQIPGVVQAHIDCRLPNRVRIRIREREGRFLWHTAGLAFLVDEEGWVLKQADGLQQGFISIRDLDDRQLQTGDRIEQTALTTVVGLHSLLPEVTSFEYSKAKGVSLLDARGWRVYFGDDQALAEKVASMHAILQQIARSGTSVKFIDLRFVGSPYYE